MRYSARERLLLTATLDDWTIAFLYHDGKLHYGNNHVAILNGLGLDLSYLGPDYGIFGRVYKQDGVFKAEIYSDFYQVNQAAAIEQIDEALQALRKRYPITELTYGPESNTIKDLDEYFDDPRLAALDYIHRSVV